MKSFEKMFFLAGLPRTGSSLLTSILSQNPDILSEGSSALLQILILNENMTNDNIEIAGGINESFINTNRGHVKKTIIESIPDLYYKNTPHKIIIDKQRNWTSNIHIIKKYIDEQPKIIVTLRPIKEIFESFYSLAIKNNKLDWFYDLISFGAPFMNSFENLKNSLELNKNYFLFIRYEDLLNKPQEVIKKIYNFLQIDNFNHNFDTIKTKYQEGDYGIDGLHEVRTKISKRELNIELPENVLNRANYLQKDLEIAFKMAGIKNVF